VERGVATSLGQGDYVVLEMNDMDFGTTKRVVDAINRVNGPGTAQALDGRTVQVRAPADAGARVGFIGELQALDVTPVQQVAKVVVNSRTGSVVMNQAVSLQNVAVAHGNLSVTVGSDPFVSQPNPLSNGQTVAGTTNSVDVKQQQASLINVPAGANLADVVKALNSVGANPMDLISILQAMKAAGALRAELEVI